MSASDVAFVVEIVIVLAAAASIGWYFLNKAPSRSGAGNSRQNLAAGERGGLSVSKYHPIHVAIHWFVVFAMAQLLIRGAFIMVNIPNSDPAKLSGLRAHMFAGSLVLILMMFRLVLLKTTRLPPVAKAPTPLLDRVKDFVHPMLYVSIFVQASAGLGMAFQSGLPRILLTHQGTLPASFWIYPLRTVHYVNSRILMALIALHMCGALYHTFVLKDGLIRRMSFGRRHMAPRQSGPSSSEPVVETLPQSSA